MIAWPDEMTTEDAVGELFSPFLWSDRGPATAGRWSGARHDAAAHGDGTSMPPPRGLVARQRKTVTGSQLQPGQAFFLNEIKSLNTVENW